MAAVAVSDIACKLLARGGTAITAGCCIRSTTTPRTNLLEEAMSGFSRAMMDFQEQSVVNRSQFGRALCLKELGRHEKAQQELQSLMAKVSREDACTHRQAMSGP